MISYKIDIGYKKYKKYEINVGYKKLKINIGYKVEISSNTKLNEILSQLNGMIE